MFKFKNAVLLYKSTKIIIKALQEYQISTQQFT
jgi:hypothetical protein